MEILSIVLSGLALLAAAVSLTVSVVERVRNKKRNTALLDYIDKVDDRVECFINETISQREESLEALNDAINTKVDRSAFKTVIEETQIGINEKASLREIEEIEAEIAEIKQAAEEIKKFDDRLKNLEGGLVPNFEEAKAATEALDKFNAGFASVFNYDPMEAAHRND